MRRVSGWFMAFWLVLLLFCLSSSAMAGRFVHRSKTVCACGAACKCVELKGACDCPTEVCASKQVLVELRTPCRTVVKTVTIDAWGRKSVQVYKGPPTDKTVKELLQPAESPQPTPAKQYHKH